MIAQIRAGFEISKEEADYVLAHGGYYWVTVSNRKCFFGSTLATWTDDNDYPFIIDYDTTVPMRQYVVDGIINYWHSFYPDSFRPIKKYLILIPEGRRQFHD